MTTHIIDKTKIDKFVNGDMTYRECKEFVDTDINNRFEYIVSVINQITERKECGYTAEHYVDYDPDEWSYDFVSYEHRSDNIPGRFTKYDNRFPVEWLYKDFEKDLRLEVIEFFYSQQTKTQNLLDRNKHISAIHDKIIAKLTAEELSYVNLSFTKVSIRDIIAGKKAMISNVGQKYKRYRLSIEKPMSYDDWILSYDPTNQQD